MDAVTMRIGWTKNLQMAWRYGGKRERQLVLLVISAFPIAGGVLAVANIFLVFAQPASQAMLQVNLITIMAAFSWSLFQPLITAPMYSNAYYWEAIQQRWLSPLQSEYAAEIVRYRKAVDGESRTPRHFRGAVAYALFYDVGVGISALFAFMTFPVLRGWTWVTFAAWYVPLVVVLWRSFWHRMRKEGDVAAKMGFRMRDIGAQMLFEIRKEKDSRRRFL